jgi:hypothetical protein
VPIRLFLPLLPALLLATGCAAQPAIDAVRRSGDAIVFDGRIDFASSARFLELLADPAVNRLVITSPGGLVAPSLDMAQAIHARGLALEVPSTCLSSCANYIFPAASRKLLGRPDAVGWHGNMAHVLYLQQSGQATWPEESLAQARVLARREADLYSATGVDGFIAWFGKLAPYQADEFYYVLPEDMARFGIRDVTISGARAVSDPARHLLAVDWASLEALRPAVRLDE